MILLIFGGKKNPHRCTYTWSNKDASRQSRLDYWLVSRSLANRNTSVDIQNSPLTDHKAILLSLNLSPGMDNDKKATIWKLNSSILKYD